MIRFMLSSEHTNACRNQGDVRSRLVRLIPPAPLGSSLDAVRTLLSHRLPLNALESEARDEWRSIIEGHSPLWLGIPNDRKEVIRGSIDNVCQTSHVDRYCNIRFPGIL